MLAAPGVAVHDGEGEPFGQSHTCVVPGTLPQYPATSVSMPQPVQSTWPPPPPPPAPPPPPVVVTQQNASPEAASCTQAKPSKQSALLVHVRKQ